MEKHSRFESPSSPINLRAMLRKATGALWICLVMALAIHLIMVQVRISGAGKRAFKPLSIKFVKREPRLAKPLELRKRPRPKPRIMKRKMMEIKAKVSTKGLRTSSPLKVLDSMVKPHARVSRKVSFVRATLEPFVDVMEIKGVRNPEHCIDMSLEMLDIEALDTGKYHAMVIQDSRDKKSIRGYFHLAVAYSESMNLRTNPGTGLVRLLNVLSEAMNKYTDIATDIIGRYTFDSKKLFKTPFILITAGGVSPQAETDRGGFEISQSEGANLGKYLLNGGFAFVDDDNCGGEVAEACLRAMIRKSLAENGYEEGKDWNFERLPNDHPLYHCYFDFDGVPISNDNFFNGILTRNPEHGLINYFPRGVIVKDYLEGIIIDGRLILILSLKDFTTAWVGWGNPGSSIVEHHELNNTRQRQFGVNVIVFALTQEGSITQQVMGQVR